MDGDPASTPAPAREDDASARTATALTLIVAALAALGLVLVYSSTSVGIALEAHDHTLFLRRQLLWVVLAGGAFVLTRTTDSDWVRRWSWPGFLACVLLLLLVLVPGIGHEVGGSRRWIRAAGVNGQPSELAKLGLIVFLAGYCAGRRAELATLRGALPPLGAVGLVSGLIAVEPDMSTAVIAGTVATALLLVAGVRVRHLLLVGTPAAGVLIAFAATRLAYVWERVGVFLDPSADPQGAGYQTRQALIALGSGGAFGRGLGAGQQKLLFLPDVHTDFIFALVGEELGFAGTLGVLVLFAAFVAYGMRAVDRARDEFSFLLAAGIVLTIGLHATLNIAVATASVPPTGLALPFVSFGGSHLLGSAVAAGLLVRIAAEGRDPRTQAVPGADRRGEVAPA